MRNAGLLLPLVAAVLGACSSIDSAPRGGDSSMQPRVEPTLRVTPGVAADQAAYLAGKQFLRDGDFAAALVEFRRAITLNANNVDAFVGVGVAHSMAQRQPEAVTAFRQAVALAPGNPEWQANLGMALARDGQFEEAQATLAKAWSMAPGNSRIEAQYARVAQAADDKHAAATAKSRQAAGVTVISNPEPDRALRKVGERMFELDLDPPVAADHAKADDAANQQGIAATASFTPGAAIAPFALTAPGLAAASVIALPPLVAAGATDAPVAMAESDEPMPAQPPEAASDTETEVGKKALESARNALYDRRLEAARIRAARTAAIDSAAVTGKSIESR